MNASRDQQGNGLSKRCFSHTTDMRFERFRDPISMCRTMIHISQEFFRLRENRVGPLCLKMNTDKLL